MGIGETAVRPRLHVSALNLFASRLHSKITKQNETRKSSSKKKSRHTSFSRMMSHRPRADAGTPRQRLQEDLTSCFCIYIFRTYHRERYFVQRPRLLRAVINSMCFGWRYMVTKVYFRQQRAGCLLSRSANLPSFVCSKQEEIRYCYINPSLN